MEKKYLVVAALALILAVVVTSCAPAATVTPTTAVGAERTPGVLETATVETPAVETPTVAAGTPTTMESPTPLAGAETPTP